MPEAPWLRLQASAASRGPPRSPGGWPAYRAPRRPLRGPPATPPAPPQAPVHPEMPGEAEPSLARRSLRHPVPGDDMSIFKPRRRIPIVTGNRAILAEPHQRCSQNGHDAGRHDDEPDRWSRLNREEAPGGEDDERRKEQCEFNQSQHAASQPAASAPDAPGSPPSRPRCNDRDAAIPRNRATCRAPPGDAALAPPGPEAHRSTARTQPPLRLALAADRIRAAARPAPA